MQKEQEIMLGEDLKLQTKAGTRRRRAQEKKLDRSNEQVSQQCREAFKNYLMHAESMKFLSKRSQ